MRVLFLSRVDDLSDRTSVTVAPRRMIQLMLEEDPELFVTWVISASVTDAEVDEFVREHFAHVSNRLEFRRIWRGRLRRMLGYFSTEEVWHTLTQTKVDVPYDVVLCGQPGMAPQYATILANRYQASRWNVNVPIVEWHLWTATARQEQQYPAYFAGEADVVAESMSALFAWNVWESEALYDEHLATMRQYLQPAAVKTIMEHSTVVPNGVDVTAIKAKVRQARAERAMNGGKPNLLWGGMLTSGKAADESIEVMAEAERLAGGRLGEVIVSTPMPESDRRVQQLKLDHPRWRVLAGVGREAWVRDVLPLGDLFVCNVRDETYGIGWLEMLAAGMIGVYRDAPWVQGLVPPEYPFVLNTVGEQARVVAALVKQFPNGKLWGWCSTTTEWVERLHDDRRSARKFLEVLHERKREAIAADAAKAASSLGQLAREAAEAALAIAGSPVPEALVWAQMTEMSESHREFGVGEDVATRMYLRRLVEGNGWRDTCQSRNVYFAKEASDADGR